MSFLRPFAPLFFAFLLLAPLGRGAVDAPAPICFSPSELELVRERIAADGEPARFAYLRLIEMSDPLLAAAPLSVLDKRRTAPSGDKHDYFSIGNYTWPNPATPDGVPYIRRDGYRNPEAQNEEYDKKSFNLTVLRVNLLSLAWYHSRDEKYAAKAAELLRVWFLDAATRMNPHLNHAVSQPGVHDGHYLGVIEATTLIEMLDHVRLLASSQAWTEADDVALRAWFFDFTTWLLESEFGKTEAAAENNHGTWYQAQVAVYSLYTGHPDRVRSAVARVREHIGRQIAEDGSLPRELARNRSFSYSIYGVRPFAVVADCASRVGEDLWNYRSPEGRGIRDAVDYLSTYLAGKKPWEREDVTPEAERIAMRTSALVMLRQAGRAYKDAALAADIRAFAASLPQDDRRVALLGTDPTE